MIMTESLLEFLERRLEVDLDVIVIEKRFNPYNSRHLAFIKYVHKLLPMYKLSIIQDNRKILFPHPVYFLASLDS